MAVAETITNIIASDIRSLSDIKLSANWMAATGPGGEDQKLFDLSVPKITVALFGEEEITFQ